MVQGEIFAMSVLKMNQDFSHRGTITFIWELLKCQPLSHFMVDKLFGAFKKKSTLQLDGTNLGKLFYISCDLFINFVLFY